MSWYDFREIQRRVIRDITDPESNLNADTNPTYIPPYMTADGWYLPEGGTSMMFHSRRHGLTTTGCRALTSHDRMAVGRRRVAAVRCDALPPCPAHRSAVGNF